MNISKINTDLAMKYDDWIPINSLHKPRIGSNVLVTYKEIHTVEKQVGTAYYIGDNEWKLFNEHVIKSNSNIYNYNPISILAWMPTPIPY